MSSGSPGESYTFTYATGQTLIEPFSLATFATKTLLTSVGATGLGANHSFQYAYGEMNQVTTPLGGVLQWQHRTFTFTGPVSVREVANRWMTASPGATTRQWGFYRDDTGDASRSIHSLLELLDMGTNTWKLWEFTLSGTSYTLPYAYYELRDWTSLPLVKAYTWTPDPVGNTYLQVLTTYLDYAQSQGVQTKTVQSRDIYGNLSQSQVMDV